MLFYVIQKLNNKECIIYDVENGGVCCCTTYTLNQLIEMGHKIKGYEGQSLYEVDLKGNMRENKAPNMCEDLTKRSAVTIAKGLDEKHYPRIKQKRGGIPAVANKGVTEGIVVYLNDRTQVTLHIGDVKKFILCGEKSREIIGVITQIKDTSYSSDKVHTLSIMTKEGQAITIETKGIRTITSCRLDEKIRDNFDDIVLIKNRINELQKQINILREEWNREQAKINQKYREKIATVEERKRKLEEQEVKGITTLSKLQGLVTKQQMKEAILNKMRDKMGYTVIKDSTNAGVRGQSGEFELNTYYSKGIWEFVFSAEIVQRTSYHALANSPFFFQEYDGCIVPRTEKELEELPEWKKQKAYYEGTIEHKIQGGKINISLNVGEENKGWYYYNYNVVFKFKGNEQLTIEEFKKMLKEIN